MWKTNASAVPSVQLDGPTKSDASKPNNSEALSGASVPRVIEHSQAMIGRGIILKGDISGTGPLYVDGVIEGNISLPGERVTIGANGRVSASMMSSTTPCISAQELVIMGQVFGNVSATDRVEIREDGSLTGDIMTARVSIADGAFFKGGIDIRRPDRKPPLPPSKNHGEAMHLTTSLRSSTEKEPA